MNIAVLEGYVCNPGDLSWDGFERYGDVTVYERTPRETLAPPKSRKFFGGTSRRIS